MGQETIKYLIFMCDKVGAVASLMGIFFGIACLVKWEFHPGVLYFSGMGIIMWISVYFLMKMKGE